MEDIKKEHSFGDIKLFVYLDKNGKKFRNGRAATKSIGKLMNKYIKRASKGKKGTIGKTLYPVVYLHPDGVNNYAIYIASHVEDVSTGEVIKNRNK